MKIYKVTHNRKPKVLVCIPNDAERKRALIDELNEFLHKKYHCKEKHYYSLARVELANKLSVCGSDPYDKTIFLLSNTNTVFQFRDLEKLQAEVLHFRVRNNMYREDLQQLTDGLKLLSITYGIKPDDWLYIDWADNIKRILRLTRHGLVDRRFLIDMNNTAELYEEITDD